MDCWARNAAVKMVYLRMVRENQSMGYPWIEEEAFPAGHKTPPVNFGIGGVVLKKPNALREFYI